MDMGQIILEAVKKKTNTIIEEEAEKAATIVRERLKSVADEIALSVMTHYDIQIQGQKIIISVDKRGVR